MELKDYIKILGKHKWLVFAIAIIFALTLYFWQASKPIEFQGSLTLIFSNKQEQTADYKFDNYYNILASGNLASNVEYWLSSPSFVATIYKNANVALPSTDLKELQKVFTTQRFAPDSSTLVIKTSARSGEETQNLLTNAFRAIDEKMKSLQADGQLSNNFSLIKLADPFVLAPGKNNLQNVIIGLFSGLVLGAILAFIKEYLKP
ncbi:MAG: Uncharacterized protein CEN89_88 [Candidatus Berkelbacteria bacterium Licking1014_7]|uniref:Polysaccharide chain length determinant N-terminal domain-containing protein n=1 Tax=Candidatus Berkelbacteria bacterium Licking1014_7 TaxID=2017147 RepID=A0A554LKM0_9BACT|nr:MAG: Uncharacterized protein CEN89_88 [Candidatus Berkelbacteria bacterium Licking1014_7]